LILNKVLSESTIISGSNHRALKTSDSPGIEFPTSIT